MKELSVFIDESGDFGHEYDIRAGYECFKNSGQKTCNHSNAAPEVTSYFFKFALKAVDQQMVCCFFRCAVFKFFQPRVYIQRNKSPIK